MNEEWIEISYRDFWDVPRVFILRIDGKTLLADCIIDEALEDYPDTYTIFELDTDFEAPLTGSWMDIHARVVSKLGEIRVADVVFDETKRKFVWALSFKRILK